MGKRISTVERLRRKGFDDSLYVGGKRWKVRCSRCEALVINGIPAHEEGCPNFRQLDPDGPSPLWLADLED